MNSKAKSWIAIGTIIMVALGLMLIWTATDRANHHYGPSKIRVTEQGEIWILSDGKLHVFDAAGSEQRVLRFADWKRAALQSDFYPLQDGDVLLAEPESHEVYRCTPSATCSPLLAASRGMAGKTANAMMLAVDENRQRLYVADNAGHRLLLLDMEGNLLDDGGKAKSRFWYPNHLMFSDGELLVTDTNHKRIVRMPVADDRFGGEAWTLHTAAAEVRAGRKWPMSFVALPDGGWWVAIAQEGMRHADVAMFNANKLPIGHLALESHADPVSLALAGDRVLMADTENFRIRQSDLQGNLLPDFGPAVFRQDLAGLASEAKFWRDMRLLAQGLVVLAPLLAVFLLWRMGERPTPAPASFNFAGEPSQIPQGETIWLYPRPRFIKQQTWLLWVYVAALAGLTVWAAWLFPQFAKYSLPASWLLGGLFALAVLPLLLIVPIVSRLPRNRLGTDGIQLLHDKGDGAVHAFPLDQALSDGRILMAGQRLIAMRIGTRSVYEQDELEGFILSRLGKNAKVSPRDLFVAGMRQGNRVMWINTIAIALLVIAVLVAELNKTAIKQYLHQLLQ